MKLRYSARAGTDIAHIHDYISQHNQSAAIAVVQRIRSTCELLVRFPGLGRDTDIAGVRVFPIARYPTLSIIGSRETSWKSSTSATDVGINQVKESFSFVESYCLIPSHHAHVPDISW